MQTHAPLCNFQQRLLLVDFNGRPPRDKHGHSKFAAQSAAVVIDPTLGSQAKAMPYQDTPLI